MKEFRRLLLVPNLPVRPPIVQDLCSLRDILRSDIDVQ